MLAAFQEGAGQKAEDMPEGDPLRVRGERAAAYFTDGVGLLKTYYPNESIRDLMAMTWDIVGHRIVSTAIGPAVPSLTLAVAGNPVAPHAMIFIPHNWVAMIDENPTYQLGALVFVGSQAVDFYNSRILRESEAAKKRARAYEAEYLITLRDAGPSRPLNEWQEGLLRDFPVGLRTESVVPLLYRHKPFTPPA